MRVSRNDLRRLKSGLRNRLPSNAKESFREPAPSLQHSDLLKPEEVEAESDASCPECVRLGEQGLNVNQRVAAEMAEMLSSMLLTRTLKRFAVYFDLESGI